MRRMWAAGAAIVMCLALGGVPVVAQEATGTPSASTTAASVPALVTGKEQCVSGGYSDTNVNGVTRGQIPEFTCTITMSDPRVTGSAKGSLFDACYPASGCIYWGTYEITGPQGTWAGPWSGVDDPNLGKASFQIILQGTGAYDGWTFLAHWLDPMDGGPATATGQIYQGPPPPLDPLPSATP